MGTVEQRVYYLISLHHDGDPEWDEFLVWSELELDHSQVWVLFSMRHTEWLYDWGYVDEHNDVVRDVEWKIRTTTIPEL